ncbi:FAD-binding oxidoreductase, partial [Chloroflexota bacterium]
MKTQSRYSKVTDEIITLLTDIVGDKNVLTEDGLENYSRDEMLGTKLFVPEVVVKPENSSSVARILK